MPGSEENPTPDSGNPQPQKSPAEQAEGQPPTQGEQPEKTVPSPEAQAAMAAEEKPQLGNDDVTDPGPNEKSEGATTVTPDPKDPPDPGPEGEPPAQTSGPVNTNKPPNYPACFIDIAWQNRPIKEVGVNGCQVVDVLRVAYEKVSQFQAGPFRCLENDKVLTYLNNAIQWDERRTSLRKMQHVEGTNMPHNSTT